MEPLSNTAFDNWDETNRQSVAFFLGETIHNHDQLWREIGGILTRAVWKGIARSRQEGESTFWTQIEEQAHDSLLGEEYAGIESEIFIRLKEKLRNARENSATTYVGLPASPQFARQTSTEQTKGRVLAGASESELMSFFEMQTMVKSLDPSLIGDEWKKEPGKTILWLCGHGTQEQLFAYIYRNADQIDDEMKKTLLRALAEDEYDQVPLVWKTVLVRALSGSQRG